jgi:hypothetical protein
MRRRLFPVLFSSSAPAVPWYLSGSVPVANCVAAYQSKGVASLAASYVNLANPGTYDLTEGVAPTFDTATGWTGDGTKYLRTGIATLVNVNSSMICRYSNAAGFSPLIGTRTTAKRWTIYPVFNAVMRVYVGTSVNDIGTTTITGVVCVAGTKLYINGAFSADVTSITSQTADELYVVGMNEGGVGFGFNGKVQAASFYNSVLTPEQVALITTAMSAL